MTNNHELLWNQAIDNEDYELAETLASTGAAEETDTAPEAPKRTFGSDVDIIRVYDYWGLPLPGLPIQGTP